MLPTIDIESLEKMLKAMSTGERNHIFDLAQSEAESDPKSGCSSFVPGFYRDGVACERDLACKSNLCEWS